MNIARGLKLDPDYVGGGTFALLAKKGAGKTYAARVMAEEFWKAKVPFVFIDPMGSAWGLRSSADGEGEGIPVAIFGGHHGDAPLERTSGAMLADLQREEHLSMVLDLSELGSRAAERQFAQDFLERMYRGRPHLLIDEADLFAPQNPQAGDKVLLGVTENVVRRGRNRGIGITLITQRPAVLNKDVLTQADGLVAMRITGLTDREAIDAWVRGHSDPEEAAEVKGTLSGLGTGESWWWVPEQSILKRVQVRRSRTFDSSPTRTRGAKAQEPKSFADVDMAAVQEKMADTIERAKQEDPKELRRAIAELKKQLAERPEPEPEKVEVPVLQDEQLGELRAALERSEKLPHDLARVLERSLADLAKFTQPIVDELARIEGQATQGRRESRTRDAQGGAASKPAGREAPPVEPPRNPPDEGELSKGATGLLETLACRHPMRVSRSQLATLAGRSIKSSSFTAQVSELRRETLVEDRDGLLELTEAGAAVGGAEDAEPLGRDEVISMWRRALPSGPRRMLDALLTHGGPIERDELADAAGFSPTSSSVQAHLKVLRSNGLVRRDGGHLVLGAEIAL